MKDRFVLNGSVASYFDGGCPGLKLVIIFKEGGDDEEGKGKVV